MDQKRLFLAIAVSMAILLGFQMLVAPHLPQPPPPPPQIASSETAPARRRRPPPPQGSPVRRARPPARRCRRNVPRVKIEAPRVRGSISLLGARIDDLVLNDYRETLEPNSPLVRLLEPRSDEPSVLRAVRLDRARPASR